MTQSNHDIASEPATTEVVEPTVTSSEEANATDDERAPDRPLEETDEGKAGREAAKYRRQLREVEAARDGLADHLAAARRLLVEHHLGNLPAAAFWGMHPEVADLIADDGTIDRSKVTAAAEAVHQALELPGQFSNAPKGAVGPYVPGEGGSVGPVATGLQWTDAFGPEVVQGARRR